MLNRRDFIMRTAALLASAQLPFYWVTRAARSDSTALPDLHDDCNRQQIALMFLDDSAKGAVERLGRFEDWNLLHLSPTASTDAIGQNLSLESESDCCGLYLLGRGTEENRLKLDALGQAGRNQSLFTLVMLEEMPETDSGLWAETCSRVGIDGLLLLSAQHPDAGRLNLTPAIDSPMEATWLVALTHNLYHWFDQNLIGVDPSDIIAAYQAEMPKRIGIGHADSPAAIAQAAEKALASLRLQGRDPAQARSIWSNIFIGDNATIEDFNLACQRVCSSAHPDAQMLIGMNLGFLTEGDVMVVIAV